MYLPAMPRIGTNLGTTVAAVVATISVDFLALGVAQLVYGPWSGQVGRKPPVYVGRALFALANLGCALAPSIAAGSGWLSVHGQCQSWPGYIDIDGHDARPARRDCRACVVAGRHLADAGRRAGHHRSVAVFDTTATPMVLAILACATGSLVLTLALRRRIAEAALSWTSRQRELTA